MNLSFIRLGCVIFCMVLFFWSCNREEVSLSTQREICRNIANQRFEETIPFMNSYLQRLESNDDNALGKFENWLNSVSCIKNAAIHCNSCLFSLPPQSVVKVIFSSPDQDIEMTIHVLMAEKLEVVRIFAMD